MSDIDLAIEVIQSLACSMETVDVKSAPDYPIENVDPLPMVVSYLGSGEFMFTNATVHHNFPVIVTEFHLSRVNLREAYKQAQSIAIEFPQLLAGNPTLDGTVQTIVATSDNRFVYTIRPFVWRENPALITHMVRFDIPIKLLKAPVTV